MIIHQFEQFDFDLSLIQEWFLVLDYFNGNMTLVLVVVSFHHLPKGTSTNEGINLVSIEEFLSSSYYVIMIIVIKAIIV